jgi:arylsulfatase
VRSEFAYVADIAPTILDLVGVPLAPVINNVAQSPMEGRSLKARLLSDSAPVPSRAQYFEMYGNKGLWNDGWAIVTSHRLDPWRMDQMNPITEAWELYDTLKDPGQTTNLAARYPEKVDQLAALFEAQASRFNVNPISNFGDSRAFAGRAFMAEMAARQGLWAFDRPVSNIGFGAAPPVALRPFDMKAQIHLETGTEDGPVFAFGGSSGGMAAYITKGIPAFAFRDLSGRLQVIEAPAPLPSGSTALTVRLERTEPRPMSVEKVTVTISAGDKVLVSKDVTTTIPAAYGVAETFDVGIDRGSAVSPAYRPDQPFSGGLGKVSFQFR